MVDGDGEQLTGFDGPFATDALPVATALGAVEDYMQGAADPACARRPNTDCWTAFEIWIYLEDWAASHCTSDVR